MKNKIRIGAVSYLNTKPLIYGFEHGEMQNEIDLLIDYPAKIAEMLTHNEIDAGLVPVAIIPEMKEHFIISDYCIGCDGEVASVCLFSEVPLHKIEKILLDYQSRSSVDLLKVLIKECWKIDPDFINTTQDYRNDISGTTAGLVIGDRALTQRKISTYHFDLGLEWKNFTGLPFVFAAWVSNKKLAPTFINQFNKANAIGLQNIDKVVAENLFTDFDLKDYYTSFINYDFDENKKMALNLFIKKLNGLRF